MKRVLWMALFCISLGANAQPFEDYNTLDFEEEKGLDPIDSLLKTLTLEEQIAQLMMVAVYPKKGEVHDKAIDQIISEYKVGGIIVFQGKAEQVVEKINRFQNGSEIPLLTAIDAEWGPAMRISNTPTFPKAMALGAVRNDSLIYFMGREIGRELRRMGIQINFAPVVDVNSNANNPVIGLRSFGEDPEMVTQKAAMYSAGMQDEGVMAVIKHFPGHGDTDTDSHHALPVVSHDRARLDSIELKPFASLIKQGAQAVMMAHLHVPALDSAKGSISSLSPTVVTGLLKEEWGFDGLVFTDALNMKGASNSYGSGAVEVKALKAGVDVLLMPKDVSLAIQKIKEAIDNKELSKKQIKKACRKILQVKHEMGLSNLKPVTEDSLTTDLNNPTAQLLDRKLTAESLTLLVNQQQILPLANLNQRRLVSLSIGNSEPAAFNAMLKRYAPVETMVISKKAGQAEINGVRNRLMKDDIVIVSFEGHVWTPDQHFGFAAKWRKLVATINNEHPTILVMFGNPYTLRDWVELERLNAVLVAYQNTALAQELSAQVIMGGYGVNGTLPVSINEVFPVGFGLAIDQPIRLGYSIPEEEGIDGNQLIKVDSLAEQGIIQRAYPGCQIIAVKNQKVIFEKNLGYYTYDSLQPVSPNTVYDVASITKIAATVLTLMKLEDDGRFSLDHTLGDYLQGEIDSTAYHELSVKSVLAHQAGLTSWIPFYLNTLDSNGYKPRVFSEKPTTQYPVQVADDLYIHRSFTDSIYHWIFQSPLRTKIKYLYSDIGYYFFLKIIEETTQNVLNDVTNNLFYAPLGLKHTTFLPLEKMDRSAIAPTENDTLFRDQLIQGYVHDPGAAMLGGVGGHAGLFSTAGDLAVIMQMLLNGGTYGGERFLSDSVIAAYTACQFCEDDNRRGAGFDKPVRDDTGGPSCNCVSYDSFGHSGFTGTLVWADPEQEVVYVFLSNRIYPDAENRKLITMNIRTEIQETLYQSLGTYYLH